MFPPEMGHSENRAPRSPFQGLRIIFPIQTSRNPMVFGETIDMMAEDKIWQATVSGYDKVWIDAVVGVVPRGRQKWVDLKSPGEVKVYIAGILQS